MAATDWYRNWFNSPFYHRLYFDGKEEEGNHFIENLLTHLKPAPRSRLLDAGCGKGGFSRLLAAQGYDVTGVDLAPENIQEAQKGEKGNLHFYVHDLRLPFWIRYFDAAFSLSNAFGYYATRREHDDAVRTLAASLKPGGTLVFTEKIAKFSLGDFTDMLSYQRVQVTEIFGDYHLQPYHVKNTPRLIVVAKKEG